MITQAGTMLRPTFAELRELLSTRLPRDAAVTVPVGGRKAVMANARWGAVATDFGTLDWTGAHRGALGTITTLLSLGFTEGLLSRESPPFGILSKLPPAQHMEVRQLWYSLAPWRRDVEVWPLLVRLTRKDKDTADDE